MKNLLLIHGGGPTAVINASLYGAITEAKKWDCIENIYGAIGGTGGFLNEEIADLTNISNCEMEKLLTTPGSAIGTSRDHLEPEEYRKMASLIEKYEIGWVLCNGGNGTMDMCGRLYQACCDANVKVNIMGIPKTMDNDIALTDHAPGYASAARYIAQSVKEVCADVKGLPIHVVVVEASGRNAGWITAASALSKGDGCDGPDLIYLPERPFVEEQFLKDVKNCIKEKGGVVVVASEGLHDENKKPIVEPIFSVGRDVYFGDVSTHLANLIIKKLGYKARGEKPGLLGRASIALQSPIDVEEAILVGKVACQSALQGETGKMVALRRVGGETYKCETFLVPVEEVMLTENTMPSNFINENGNGVTNAFIQWCKPLIGIEFPNMITLKNKSKVRK